MDRPRYIGLHIGMGRYMFILMCYCYWPDEKIWPIY